MRMMLGVLALLAATPGPVDATEAVSPAEPRFVTKAYDPAADANAAVDRALAEAKVSHRILIVSLGANWCHDSAAFANLLASPRFKPMIERRFVLLFIDVGKPQIGEGRNLDIARRFGISKIKNTPTVMAISSAGKLLNRNDAKSWRNAASRDADDVYRYFETLGEKNG